MSTITLVSIRCDRCGYHTPPSGDGVRVNQNLAIANGWKRDLNPATHRIRDLCPNCAPK